LKIPAFIKDSVFSEEYAVKDGFLQHLGPRLKIILAFLLIFGVLMTKSLSVLGCLYLSCLALAIASKINLGYFLKRTLLFMPLFTVMVAAPAFLYGDRAGAVFLILRVTTSVSFVLLLSLVTRQSALLKGLRGLGVPLVFVMTIGMCYRYIYLFAGIIEKTLLAVKSRIGEVRLHYEKRRKITSWNIATLWQRSLQLNTEVYQAMLSRGYTGEPKTLDG